MTSFANQVALITGAGSGIGRQLALVLAREGAKIAAIDLSAEPLTSLEAELPGKSAWALADVTDRETLTRAVGELEAKLGPTDLLIANAGIGRETSALSFRAEDVEAQVRVNLIGVSNSIAAVLPGMLARQRGHLVAISSLASYRGLPRMAGYCAAKAGVNALLDSLRVELKPCGIAVTTICPGWIRTPLTTNIDIPPTRMVAPEDAARRIVAAIRRRRPFYAFPASGVWRASLVRWLPLAASDWLVGQMLRSFRKK